MKWAFAFLSACPTDECTSYILSKCAWIHSCIPSSGITTKPVFPMILHCKHLHQAFLNRNTKHHRNENELGPMAWKECPNILGIVHIVKWVKTSILRSRANCYFQEMSQNQKRRHSSHIAVYWYPEVLVGTFISFIYHLCKPTRFNIKKHMALP